MAPRDWSHGLSAPISLRLASRSLARRRLLSGLIRSSFPSVRLVLKPADVDERAIQRQFARASKIQKSKWSLSHAKKLAMALAQAKRESAELSARVGDLVLGCDQVVWSRGQIFGKPESHGRATKMLRSFSGRTVVLINAISLSRILGSKEQLVAVVQDDVQVIEMRFAELSKQEIERVLRLDRPYEAAGAFHFESHGANLLESVQCDDPTGIQGLSVMRLKRLLGRLLPVPI